MSTAYSNFHRNTTCIVIGSPIAGLIVDRFGRKPLLAVCVLLYGLSA